MNKNPTWWQTLLLTLACSIVTALFSWGLTRGGESSDSTRKDIELLNQNKADKLYVDQQDDDIKVTVIQNKLDQDKKNDLIIEYLKSVDGNVKVLLQKNNK